MPRNPSESEDDTEIDKSVPLMEGQENASHDPILHDELEEDNGEETQTCCEKFRGRFSRCRKCWFPIILIDSEQNLFR
jgi:hypothetical protein